VAKPINPFTQRIGNYYLINIRLGLA